MRSGILIGDLAGLAGVTPPTIRYYESIGLLKRAPRSEAGYRRYSAQAVDELRFIRKAQGLGFSLHEVSEILELSRSGQEPCSHVLSLGHRHLAALDERMRQLESFRQHLAAELTRWDRQQRAGSTCDGLCQLIAYASEAADLTPHTERSRGARSGRQK